MNGDVIGTDPVVGPILRRVPAPTAEQLQRLDELDEEAACMDALRGHAITCAHALSW